MITRETTIDELFELYPQKSQRLGSILTSAGLHCVGCQAATWETLEMGMLGHGFSDEAIEGLIRDLNEALKEPLPPSETITLTPKAAEKFLTIVAAEGKEGWALRFGDAG